MMESIKSKILPPYCSNVDSKKDSPEPAKIDKEKTVANERWEHAKSHMFEYFLKDLYVELDNGNTKHIESFWPTIENDSLVFGNVNIDMVHPNTDGHVPSNVSYVSDMIHLSKLNGSISESVSVRSIMRFNVRTTYDVKVIEYEQSPDHYTDEYRNLSIEVDKSPAEYGDEPQTNYGKDTIKSMLVNNES